MLQISGAMSTNAPTPPPLRGLGYPYASYTCVRALHQEEMMMMMDTNSTGSNKHPSSYQEELTTYMRLQSRRGSRGQRPRGQSTRHPRYACSSFPFAPGHYESYCSDCTCFVCEVPASQCEHWLSLKHCQAHYRVIEWQLARDRAHHGLKPVMRQEECRPISLAPVIRPNNKQSLRAAKELKDSTVEERRARYLVATERVGSAILERLERDLREKIFNRVAAGPFQLRRNFKYFDKNADGTIDVDEFAECLEYLMGVILPDENIVALFARYDADANGSMDYREFIEQLMGETLETRDRSKSLDIVTHSRRFPKQAPPFEVPPHHPLFGSEEASLASCSSSINPKTRPKPMRSYEKRLARARFARPSPEDEPRKFEITFMLDDNTISIYEPPQRNTGILGGKFLANGRPVKPDGSSFTFADAAPGAILCVGGRDFVIY